MKIKLKKILSGGFITNALIVMVVALTLVVAFITPTNLLVLSSSNMSEVYYKGNNNSNGVSLTFNVYSGSNEVEGILEILRLKNATATFFLGGCWADDNVELVEKIVQGGHEIGSHGYFHKDHAKLSFEDNYTEIKNSIDLINGICNYKVSLFAPPSGSYSKETLKACKSLDCRVIMWSNDTIDWRDKDEGLIYDRAVKNLKAGNIVLMHPTVCTVKALPRIIDKIVDSGLKTLSISKNLEGVI